VRSSENDITRFIFFDLYDVPARKVQKIHLQYQLPSQMFSSCKILRNKQIGSSATKQPGRLASFTHAGAREKAFLVSVFSPSHTKIGAKTP